MLPELLLSVIILAAAGTVALNPKAKKLLTQVIPKLSSSKEETVSLCVVIPASTVCSLEIHKNPSIDIPKVIKLLESVPYFICTSVLDGNSKENCLELDDNYEYNRITSDSMQEFYVRIDIQIKTTYKYKFIGKTDSYILQRDLDIYKDKIGVVNMTKIAMLKSFNGLESFNRI